MLAKEADIVAKAEAKVSDVVKAEVEKQTADIRVKAEGWEKKAKDLEIEMAQQKKFAPKLANKDAIGEALQSKSADLLKMKDDKFAAGVQMNVKAAATITTANYT